MVLCEVGCIARARRSQRGGAKAGLIPPIRNGVVEGFTGELIWSIQIIGDVLDSVGWRTRIRVSG